ncbi:MAG TPA: glycosyltransferase family 2 protein [Lachnospiraceae bacterium]|nr:glycosyltransferase family 2 protein [Lachnospiraceae bacterium]
MACKVSVIIPVFNGEKYIRRCMDSVLKQTLEEIEVILVDDGSKDKSPFICDEYAKSQDHIKVIHKNNGGLTAAWKTGVTMAQGDYIGFVDCDDYVEQEMFETMHDKAIESGAQIVCCGLRHEYEDHDHKPWKEQMDVEKIDELSERLINDGSFMGRGLQPNRVTKLISRELILKNMYLCDDRVSVGEDVQFSLTMFLSAQKVAMVKDYYPYIYWMNSSSMTGAYDFSYMEKISLLKEQLIKITKKLSSYDFSNQIINDYLCLTVLNVKGEIYKNKKVSYKEHRKNLQDICTNKEVMEALQGHTLSKLTLPEELFIFFMKKQWYAAIIIAVKIYFHS